MVKEQMTENRGQKTNFLSSSLRGAKRFGNPELIKKTFLDCFAMFAMLLVIGISPSLYACESYINEEITQEELNQIISNSDKMVILNNTNDNQKVYESINKKDLKELKEAIQIIPTKRTENFCDPCIGIPAVDLYSSDDKRIGHILFHPTNQNAEFPPNYKMSLSVNYKSAWVTDYESFVNWFGKRGIEIKDCSKNKISREMMKCLLEK